ncbi:hypothetical protein F4561_001413 [Lipingzhangella halophila]|uniref:Uncharacterized protein n=1 Tax=Lipingzhangella halophila TaxID=1783352 RepID=A0A7W7RFB1_9ACTN|nr:hypothetical protein [Lipingzhangella halophila]
MADPTVWSRIIHAWPSFALIGSYELLMRQFRASAACVRNAHGVSRTRKGAWYVGTSSWMWCYAKDEGWLALRRRPAGGGVKPPTAALADDCRGERCGKRRPVEASGGDQEDARKPLEEDPGVAVDVSLLRSRWHRNRGRGCALGGVWRGPADWPDGVRHGGGVSLVCGFRMEREKARPDRAAQWGGSREPVKRAAPARP